MKKIIVILFTLVCFVGYSQGVPTVNRIKFIPQGAPSSPVDGEIYAATSGGGLFYYDGTQWLNLTLGAAGGAPDQTLSLNGNDLTISGAGGNTVDLSSLSGGSSNTFNDTAEIDFTDTSGTITADLVNGSIDESKLDASTNTSLGLADTSIQPGDNISDLTNDSGYITSAQNTFNVALETNGTTLRVRDSGSNSVSIEYSEIASNVEPLLDVDDADADPNNEIELPPGGTNGQILSTDGAGNYSWADDANDGSGTITGNEAAFDGWDKDASDDSDDQNLILTGDVLSIEGGTGSVDLSNYSDGFEANTDDQTASEVPITDSGANFTATDVEGALAELAGSVGDNLGDHTATQTLDMDGNAVLNATAFEAETIDQGSGFSDRTFMNPGWWSLVDWKGGGVGGGDEFDIMRIFSNTALGRGYSIDTGISNTTTSYHPKLFFPNVQSNAPGFSGFGTADNTVAIFYGRVSGNGRNRPR